MTSYTVNLVGAKGGQGTTTLASCLAISAARNEFVSDVGMSGDHSELAAFFGTGVEPKTSLLYPPANSVENGVYYSFAEPLTIADRGTIRDWVQSDDPEVLEWSSTFLVLRNDYFAARAVVKNTDSFKFDGAILFLEEGRPLDVVAMQDVLGWRIPILGVVPVTHEIARKNDAGLLIQGIGSNRKAERPLEGVCLEILKAINLVGSPE